MAGKIRLYSRFSIAVEKPLGCRGQGNSPGVCYSELPTPLNAA